LQRAPPGRLCADSRNSSTCRSGGSKASREPLARHRPAPPICSTPRGRLTCAAPQSGPIIPAVNLRHHEAARPPNGCAPPIDDAMDIHGGKAVIDGPQNYMGNLYRLGAGRQSPWRAPISSPRNLIIFGQGRRSVRIRISLEERNALRRAGSRQRPSTRSTRPFWKHIGHSVTHAVPRLGPKLERRRVCARPRTAGSPRTGFYRQPLALFVGPFALCADMALLTPRRRAEAQGDCCRRGFGDILSELYLLSAVLKRWQDEGPSAGGFCRHWNGAWQRDSRPSRTAFAEILANLPNRFVAVVLKIPDPAIWRPPPRSGPFRSVQFTNGGASSFWSRRRRREPADAEPVLCRGRPRAVAPAGEGVPAGHRRRGYRQAHARRPHPANWREAVEARCPSHPKAEGYQLAGGAA